jgi:hypothetical protein
MDSEPMHTLSLGIGSELPAAAVSLSFDQPDSE